MESLSRWHDWQCFSEKKKVLKTSISALHCIIPSEKETKSVYSASGQNLSHKEHHSLKKVNPLDFVSDKVKDALADFTQSNRTAKITDKKAGPDSICIFQDLVIYSGSFLASEALITAHAVYQGRNRHKTIDSYRRNSFRNNKLTYSI